MPHNTKEAGEEKGFAADLKYSAKAGAIDDEPLHRVLHGHEVVEVSEHFYFHRGDLHLLAFVRYRLASRDLPQRRFNLSKQVDIQTTPSAVPVNWALQAPVWRVPRRRESAEEPCA
jgi:hypothetical protein